MGIPIIFVLFLIFIFIFQHNLKKNDRNGKMARKQFWEYEENSFFARKLPLNDNDFIKPNVHSIPKLDYEAFKALNNPQMFTVQEKCFSLADIPMLDLSGMLNSELRYRYGAANLELIESYENNYTNYIKSLYKLGKFYYDNNMKNEAISVLEEGMNVNTEISDHIILLATIYYEMQKKKEFDCLYKKALKMKSLTKNKTLQQLHSLKDNFNS